MIAVSRLRKRAPSAAERHLRYSRKPPEKGLNNIPSFELAEAAEKDLQNIAQYTLSKWGAKPAVHYGTLLDVHFEAIGKGKARTRIFLPHRPELRVSRVDHHYVFHLVRQKQQPLILAVFHENMDLMTRLRHRLEN